MDSVATFHKKSIRFRARSFVAFALCPEAPLGEWLERLDRWTENSPGFFAGRPVVLDLNTLKPDATDIGGLVTELAGRGIRVYAIEAGGIDDLGTGLPPLLKGAKPAIVDEPLLLEPEKAEAPVAAEAVEAAAPVAPTGGPLTSNSLIIHAPIRSGQSIFHPLGDVTVLGSVGSGSEIVAGGSVHVYGTLRGRVFAGATGRPESRIFCRRNEAELLAVDGWYRTADEMEQSSRGRAIQAYLESGMLQVAALN